MTNTQKIEPAVAATPAKPLLRPRLVVRENRSAESQPAAQKSAAMKAPTSPAASPTAEAPRAVAGTIAPAQANAAMSPSIAHLIRIEGELRRIATREALWQHLANEAVALLPFGQALVLESRESLAKVAQSKYMAKFKAQPRTESDATAWAVAAVSGLAKVNRDAPMLRWYENLTATLWRQGEVARMSHIFSLPSYADPADPCTEEAALRHMLWVPLVDGEQAIRTGWLLARDTEWDESHQKLAERLAQAYAHGASAIAGRAKPVRNWRQHYRKAAIGSAVAALLLAFVPVPLTTLAPVEVTPQDPFVVAAPVAGVVERILVAPGAQVKEGTPLVQLVDTTLRSEFDVATQKLEVARAKMLRFQQAAVDDQSAKRELAVAQSEESVASAELEFARAQFDKSIIKAREAGVALYGDPRDWVGRPVAVGEAIMRVANPKEVEFQIKMPVADAVNLRDGAEAKVFLDAAPLSPIKATVVRAAYKAEADAAGVASFTVTARGTDLQAPAERLGLRGTARVYGEPVSLFYYLMRRPLTALRQWTGV
ncbi:HlyD family efflux transporter periplasmic adaptor subunit [Variovorax rhizosphaerae]|uniref:HlyD family efflux transporter periplasmic adaptor subunit n=1 Tax=Variovorax rhizosphaerae TaxID=1836200 RepID=A0ABU8WQB6_9BURK